MPVSVEREEEQKEIKRAEVSKPNAERNPCFKMARECEGAT